MKSYPALRLSLFWCGKALLAAAVLLPLSCLADGGILTKGTPVKIMPVGDSITEGKGIVGAGGYRGPLYDLLTSNGYDVTFVGKEDNGDPANATGFSNGMKSPNHEGYGSARIGMLLGGGTVEKHTALPIKTSMANNNPDVVLVMLGTNDIFGITATEKMKATMDQLLTAIFAANPNVSVVLATICPIGKVPARDADVDKYNAVLPDLVTEQQGHGHKIVLANVHDAVTLAGLSGDKVHPSAEGYKKMAAAWYAALTGEAAP